MRPIEGLYAICQTLAVRTVTRGRTISLAVCTDLVLRVLQELPEHFGVLFSCSLVLLRRHGGKRVAVVVEDGRDTLRRGTLTTEDEDKRPQSSDAACCARQSSTCLYSRPRPRPLRPQLNMSSAAAKAEARRKAILSRGTDRLAKLTSSARGEGAPAYMHDGV